MTAFTVDTDAVLSHSAAVRASSDRVAVEVHAMMAQLTQLQSSWTGSAAAAFQTCIETWKAAQRQVEDSLATINASLDAAGRQYADAELTNAALFR